MNIFIWPGHAYIPGVSPPHPDGFFDDLRDTVEEGMTIAELARTDAWSSGQGYFRAGFFWEAREVWEPVAEALPARSAEKPQAPGGG